MATIERHARQARRPADLTGAGVAALVPPNDDLLSPAACESLAREITARDLWQGVSLTPTESGARAYALLYEDARMEVWLLSWLPRHSTGFHDHGESSVGFCIAQGALLEQHLRLAGPPRGETLECGDSRCAGSEYIHCLEWESGEPAVSVHVYSPPLRVVGQYREGTNGALLRETQSGRDELTKD